MSFLTKRYFLLIRQVSEKQKISPWDILEGFKNPAPLSWHWFQAVKTERKPLKYEEAFHAMKYMKNTFIKDTSHYMDPPPLPQEDLEPTKDTKEDDKNDANKPKGDDLIDPLNPGKRGIQAMKGRRGNARIMSPTGAGMSGGMGPGGMIPPGAPGMYAQAGPNNYPSGAMGYDGMNYNNSNMGMVHGGPVGSMGQQQMSYNNMGYGMQGGPGPPTAGPMAGQPGMQNMPPGARFPSGPGMTQTRPALQNMLRSRTTPGQYGPAGGGGGGPAGPQQPQAPQMGPIMRPGGGGNQYPGMMPGSQPMPGAMNRPMYSAGGGAGMGGMNPSYGMQAGGGGSYVGYGAGNQQMRMSNPAMGKGNNAFITFLIPLNEG